MNRVWVPFAACVAGCSTSGQYLKPYDFEYPPIAYDARIAYGTDSLQHGDLRLPEGPGPHPVAVVIHGGCWRAWHTYRHVERLARTLTDAGWATWNLEYRSVDRPGGGWPGTFFDVGTGTDYLREVAKRYPLDLTRAIAIGHSAGGHLALWVAGRERVPSGGVLHSDDPLALAGAISLGGIADLWSFHEQVRDACGDGVSLLIGGTPETTPNRYSQGSPAELLPIGVPQLLVHGVDDRNVPLSHVQGYVDLARRRGDDVRLVVIPQAAHFELMAPWSKAWPRIQAPVFAFLREIETRGKQGRNPH